MWPRISEEVALEKPIPLWILSIVTTYLLKITIGCAHRQIVGRPLAIITLTAQGKAG